MKIGNYTIELDVWQDWTDLREWKSFNVIGFYISHDLLSLSLLGFNLEVEFYNDPKRRVETESWIAGHPEVPIVWEDE